MRDIDSFVVTPSFSLKSPRKVVLSWRKTAGNLFSKLNILLKRVHGIWMNNDLPVKDKLANIDPEISLPCFMQE